MEHFLTLKANWGNIFLFDVEVKRGGTVQVNFSNSKIVVIVLAQGAGSLIKIR